MGFLVAVSFCVAGPASFAQNIQTPLFADQSVAGSAKTHAKKSVRKSGGATLSTVQPTSEEAEKAARLAEGRKKFFERSMGFDNGSAADSPISLGDGHGLSPAAAFKF